MTTAAVTIEKESLEGLVFPKEEVVVDPVERVELHQQLQKASALGNTEKHKVRITFEDSEGLKAVNTTIWAFTEKMIVLKGGRGIPLHRVRAISFT
jgi:uncharacterized protein (UPF0248 family)